MAVPDTLLECKYPKPGVPSLTRLASGTLVEIAKITKKRVFDTMGPRGAKIVFSGTKNHEFGMQIMNLTSVSVKTITFDKF